LKRNGVLSVALACGCASLALGGTGIALAAVGGAGPQRPAGFAPFTPASVDPGLARFVAQHADSSHLMRFTPAGTASGLGRSITVAVRIDGETARAISVHSAIASAKDQLGGAAVELAPTRFDLGGAVRVTRNLNVTAGVRYSQERDRIAPLTDGEQDSQAVYLGTQFRF